MLEDFMHLNAELMVDLGMGDDSTDVHKAFAEWSNLFVDEL